MDKLAHRVLAGPRVPSVPALRRRVPEPGRQVANQGLRRTAAQVEAYCGVLGAP